MATLGFVEVLVFVVSMGLLIHGACVASFLSKWDNVTAIVVFVVAGLHIADCVKFFCWKFGCLLLLLLLQDYSACPLPITIV